MNTNISRNSIVLAFSLLFFSLTPAEAATSAGNDSASSSSGSSMSGFAGLLAGVSIPTGSSTSGTSARFGFGLELGWKPISSLGLGAYLMRNSGPTKVSSAVDFSTTFYGVEGLLFIPLTGLHVGGRIGATSVTASSGAVSISTSPLSYGPVVGYEFSIPFSPLALGLEYNPMFVASSSEGTYSSSSFSVQNIFATARLSF